MMKRLIAFLMIAVTVTAAGAREKYSHDATILPIAAQTILKQNFKAEVSHIKTETSLGRITEYEVVLTDGTEISFDSKGNWKEIEMSPKNEIPKVFVPEAIREYVKQNQKKTSIIGIEQNRSGYTIELSNGVEMKFNANGRFLRYD